MASPRDVAPGSSSDNPTEVSYPHYSPTPSSIDAHISRPQRIAQWSQNVPLRDESPSLGKSAGVGSALWGEDSTQADTVANRRQSKRLSHPLPPQLPPPSGPLPTPPPGSRPPMHARPPPMPFLAATPANVALAELHLPRVNQLSGPMPLTFNTPTNGQSTPRSEREAYLASALAFPLEMIAELAPLSMQYVPTPPSSAPPSRPGSPSKSGRIGNFLTRAKSTVSLRSVESNEDGHNASPTRSGSVKHPWQVPGEVVPPLPHPGPGAVPVAMRRSSHGPPLRQIDPRDPALAGSALDQARRGRSASASVVQNASPPVMRRPSGGNHVAVSRPLNPSAVPSIVYTSPENPTGSDSLQRGPITPGAAESLQPAVLARTSSQGATSRPLPGQSSPKTSPDEKTASPSYRLPVQPAQRVSVDPGGMPGRGPGRRPSDPQPRSPPVSSPIRDPFAAASRSRGAEVNPPVQQPLRQPLKSPAEPISQAGPATPATPVRHAHGGDSAVLASPEMEQLVTPAKPTGRSRASMRWPFRRTHGDGGDMRPPAVKDKSSMRSLKSKSSGSKLSDSGRSLNSSVSSEAQAHRLPVAPIQAAPSALQTPKRHSSLLSASRPQELRAAPVLVGGSTPTRRPSQLRALPTPSPPHDAMGQPVWGPHSIPTHPSGSFQSHTPIVTRGAPPAQPVPGAWTYQVAPLSPPASPRLSQSVDHLPVRMPKGKHSGWFHRFKLRGNGSSQQSSPTASPIDIVPPRSHRWHLPTSQTLRQKPEEPRGRSLSTQQHRRSRSLTSPRNLFGIHRVKSKQSASNQDSPRGGEISMSDHCTAKRRSLFETDKERRLITEVNLNELPRRTAAEVSVVANAKGVAARDNASEKAESMIGMREALKMEGLEPRDAVLVAVAA